MSPTKVVIICGGRSHSIECPTAFIANIVFNRVILFFHYTGRVLAKMGQIAKIS